MPPSWQPRGRWRPEPTAEPLESPVGGGKSPYRLGRDFEAAVRGQLERRSYFVMRAQGSKGKIDLLATGKASLAVGISGLFIQCKRRGDIGSAEWNEVAELAWAAGGWPVITFRPSPRKTAYYRIDALREPRRPGRPWTEINPTDCSVILPTPSLLR
jgi:hypothetical protein